MIAFKKERYGAEVATVIENDDEVLEVVRRTDGNFEMTIHSRRAVTDRFDDLSVILKPEHFIELGKIANMALCVERDCPSFGKERVRSCGCHPKNRP